MSFPLILFTTALCSAQASLEPGDLSRTLECGGRARSYLLHVPPSYDGRTPVPLVLVFHGLGTDASTMAQICGMNSKSDRGGFLVAYPYGTGAGYVRVFNSGALKGTLGESLPDDVAFTGKLIEEIQRLARIDGRRIFAAGLSNGAMMCYRLAAELPDRIAAIAAVAGTMPAGLPPPAHGVPVIHFHGTSDQTVPYQGLPADAAASMDFFSVDETLRFWTRANGCRAEPEISAPTDLVDDGTSVVRYQYVTKDAQVRVVLYKIDGGGHTWPGDTPQPFFLGKTTREIVATDLIWEFFERHPRPTEAAGKRTEGLGTEGPKAGEMRGGKIGRRKANVGDT